MNEMTRQVLADSRLDGVVTLYEWSQNFEWPTPWALFLDLIGYSVENFGESIYNIKEQGSSQLGCVELDYLADALKEYAVKPLAVEELIDTLERVGD